MSNTPMHEQLTEAAKAVFKRPERHQWWGNPDAITESAAFDHMKSKVNYGTGYDFHDGLNANGDGPESVWFLLVCAEEAKG